jgi:O-acetyl-ADP-ribose deacetylase (regulator of RNase III)
MKEITYLKGDATKPQGDGPKIIAHCCNDKGGWGSGFVLALNAMSPKPKDRYLAWVDEPTFKLGQTLFVPIENDQLYVANMIGQEGTVGNTPHDIPPVRYEALRQCLATVRDFAESHNASVHAPMFGSALAGGNWEVIELIIYQVFENSDVPVTIYEYEPT